MKVVLAEGQTDISKPKLADLQLALDAAEAEYTNAECVYSAACRRQTAAINAVSEAQKKLNAAFALMKQNAPRSTPWADERR